MSAWLLTAEQHLKSACAQGAVFLLQSPCPAIGSVHPTSAGHQSNDKQLVSARHRAAQSSRLVSTDHPLLVALPKSAALSTFRKPAIPFASEHSVVSHMLVAAPSERGGAVRPSRVDEHDSCWWCWWHAVNTCRSHLSLAENGAQYLLLTYITEKRTRQASLECCHGPRPPAGVCACGVLRSFAGADAGGKNEERCEKNETWLVGTRRKNRGAGWGRTHEGV
eukprot:1288377-Prymnesium_polylepis.1